MLISCKECPKTYRIPDDAIPEEGRDVTCSSCGAVWFQARAPKIAATEDAAADIPLAIYEAGGALPAGEGLVIDMVLAGPPGDPVGSDLRENNAALANVAKWQPRPEPAAPMASPGHQGAVTDAGSVRRGTLRRFLSGPRPRAEAASFDAGNSAARSVRQAFRNRDRNRLTPARIFGWGLWLTAVAGLAVTITDRDLTERLWPRTAVLYAHAFPEEAPRTIEVSGVSQRYAVSSEGPVLEVRGMIANRGEDATHPVLLLSLDGAKRPERARLSEVAIPKGGERPFVLRALLPEGGREAHLLVTADLPAADPDPVSRDGYRIQHQGSAWGQSQRLLSY